MLFNQFTNQPTIIGCGAHPLINTSLNTGRPVGQQRGPAKLIRPLVDQTIDRPASQLICTANSSMGPCFKMKTFCCKSVVEGSILSMKPIGRYDCYAGPFCHVCPPAKRCPGLAREVGARAVAHQESPTDRVPRGIHTLHVFYRCEHRVISPCKSLHNP